MSLLFGRRAESRSISYSSVWSRGGDVSQITAGSIDTALRLAPVYAAVSLLGNQFAAAPLHAYRMSPDGSRARMERQPSLLVAPSAMVGPFAWKFQALSSVLLRGNAYGLVTAVDSTGWPSTIEWMHPDDVNVDEDSGPLPIYHYKGRIIDRASIVHVQGFSVPGSVVGVSPLKAFATIIETGIRAQDFGRDWFKNGAVPGGILKNTQQTVSAEVAETAKRRFKAATQGRELFVTGADWDYSTLSVPADEARFIETLKLTATQIANIYGVPPERIGGETGSSMTYGNREQDSLDLVTFGLRPWFVRFEEALSALMPRPQYAKFNIDAIVRADLKTRMEAHEIALRIGLETNDEGRAIEDRPPLTSEQKAEWVDLYRSAAATPPPAQGTTGGNP